MTLVRYGQAALIAAILALAGNVVSAQQPCPQKETGVYNRLYEVLSSFPCEIKVKCSVSKECCASGDCCKDGACCAKSKKCDEQCSCGKDSKCSCCKGSECCCDKNGKCSCSKDKTSTVKSECGCPFLSKLAKQTAIIMVMPSSMPLPAACCMEAMGMMPHPPMPLMPPGPQVYMQPPMMPPMPPFPPTPSMMPPQVMMPPMPTVCAPCPYATTVCAEGPGTLVSTFAAPVSTPKFEISAPSSSDQLEMCVGSETSICCKKMTVKIGDKEITVSRFNDRVRVRGEDLKATALSVRCDRKGHLILDGDVVLHIKKDGHVPTYGDRIEMDMSTCAMTIQRSAKPASSPASHIEESSSDR